MIKVKKVPATVHVHIKVPSRRTGWDKFRAWYDWMLSENIYPVREVGGVRAADEFTGAFYEADWEKIKVKLAELGIK